MCCRAGGRQSWMVSQTEVVAKPDQCGHGWSLRVFSAGVGRRSCRRRVGGSSAAALGHGRSPHKPGRRVLCSCTLSSLVIVLDSPAVPPDTSEVCGWRVAEPTLSTCLRRSACHPQPGGCGFSVCELRQFEQVSGAAEAILCARIKLVRPPGYRWVIRVPRHKKYAKWPINCSETPYLSTALCTVVYKPCGRLFVGAPPLFEN